MTGPFTAFLTLPLLAAGLLLSANVADSRTLCAGLAARIWVRCSNRVVRVNI
jgi:hypothetical protein